MACSTCALLASACGDDAAPADSGADAPDSTVSDAALDSSVDAPVPDGAPDTGPPSGWEIEVVEEGPFMYEGGMAIALDAENRVLVGFFDDQIDAPRIARRNAPGDWQVETIEMPVGGEELGRFIDIAVGDDGVLHVVYLARTTPSATDAMVRYASGTFGAFTVQQVGLVPDVSIGFFGARDVATLALNGGSPVVLAQGSREMWLATHDGAAFNLSPVETTPVGIAYGQQTDIVLDDAGVLHAAIWQCVADSCGSSDATPGTVRYGRTALDAIGWTWFDIDTGRKPAIDFAPGAGVHIAYLTEAEPGYVRHVAFGADATEAPVPTEVAAGYFYGPIDLALNAEGVAGVAYHDHDSADEVLALQDGAGGATFTTRAWDTPSHDGWYNTIVFSADGVAHTAAYNPPTAPGAVAPFGVIYGGYSE